jgi:hypothetical protein
MKNLTRLALTLTLMTGFAWAETITVYKSPTCGCCSEWVKIMEAAGHEVHVKHPANLQRTKEKLGVPNQLGSCHTAVINDYVFEGHIPEQDVMAFLANPPEGARGLAVPGMPAHSPGMVEEGVEYSGFNVIGFDDQNKLFLYKKY